MLYILQKISISSSSANNHVNTNYRFQTTPYFHILYFTGVDLKGDKPILVSRLQISPMRREMREPLFTGYIYSGWCESCDSSHSDVKGKINAEKILHYPRPSQAIMKSQ